MQIRSLSFRSASLPCTSTAMRRSRGQRSKPMPRKASSSLAVVDSMDSWCMAMYGKIWEYHGNVTGISSGYMGNGGFSYLGKSSNLWGIFQAIFDDHATFYRILTPNSGGFLHSGSDSHGFVVDFCRIQWMEDIHRWLKADVLGCLPPISWCRINHLQYLEYIQKSSP